MPEGIKWKPPLKSVTKNTVFFFGTKGKVLSTAGLLCLPGCCAQSGEFGIRDFSLFESLRNLSGPGVVLPQCGKLLESKCSDAQL